MVVSATNQLALACLIGLLVTLFFQLYKSAIGNIFEEEDWGPLEYAIMAKHFDRQGKTPYMYHSVSVPSFL